MVIYKTTNLINGKYYIGKSIKSGKRLERYLGSGKILNNAIKKYGKENFRKEILQECSSKEDLDEREIFWIKKLDSCNPNIGYNVCTGGSGGDTISKNVNRNKICQKIKDSWKECESRKFRLDKQRRIFTSKKHRKLMSDLVKSQWDNNPERKRIMSKNQIGIKNPVWRGYVYAYDPNMKLYKRYDCIRSAFLELQMNEGTFRRNLEKFVPVKAGKYKGFKFIISKNPNLK